MAHPNVDRTQQAYDLFAQGDLETLFGMMTDDIVWNVPGESPIAGTYRGKEEVSDFFMQIMEMSKGTFRIEPRETIANDHFAATLVATSAEREGIRAEREPSIQVTRFRDGKICEFWAHPYDMELFDELWSA